MARSPLLPAGSLPSLIKIRNDREPIAVVRIGRFACEAALWGSKLHLFKVLEQAQERMIEGLKHHPDGPYEYRDAVPGGEFKGFRIRGPLEHVPISEDMTPDKPFHDPPPPPPPSQQSREVLRNYMQICREYEAAEQARVARRSDPTKNLIDFELRAHFIRRVDLGHRVHVPDQHEVKAILAAKPT